MKTLSTLYLLTLPTKDAEECRPNWVELSGTRTICKVILLSDDASQLHVNETVKVLPTGFE